MWGSECGTIRLQVEGSKNDSLLGEHLPIREGKRKEHARFMQRESSLETPLSVGRATSASSARATISTLLGEGEGKGKGGRSENHEAAEEERERS